jgi:hypothetical protein
VAGFSKMKVAMDNDPNLNKVKNETKKGMKAAGSFFETIFRIKNVSKDEKLLNEVEI